MPQATKSSAVVSTKTKAALPVELKQDSRSLTVSHTRIHIREVSIILIKKKFNV